MILAIDSGNTFFKWGLSNDGLWFAKGKISNTEISLLLDSFKKLPVPSQIVISHVATDNLKNDIDAIFSLWPVKPYWISACASQCGVSNGYHNPEQLGCDRWAALVAAWNIHHQACMVVNIGTAVTIDALSNSGVFLGGIIFPSINLMRDCLQSKTQIKNLQIGSFKNFPQSTDDAVQSGLMHCVLGTIERLYCSISEQLKTPNLKCFISGGGCIELAPFIKIPYEIIDNLVLEGLVIIANNAILDDRNNLSKN
ncbi:type III pantothenate kinase [Nitrosomonas sp.]|uniref:type III pantothenate kinase n=1 Tax=Nitrosomonas sp. TaxID=42353 RepID=UPI0035AF5D2B